MQPLIHDIGDERERLHARSVHVIDGVLRRYMADGSLDADEADDVRSVVMLRLAQRFGQGAPAADIRSLDDFVATMAHNAACDVFRGRLPDRTRLLKRVRAIVREDKRFLVLRDASTWCALREHASAPRVDAVTLARADFAAARSLPVDEVIALLLGRAGGPIRFEQLVDLIIEATGMVVAGESIAIGERPEQPERPQQPEQPFADGGPAIEARLIARETIVALWDEIRALPLPQRTALLLHLRDHRGASAIPLLVFTGTATLDEIGAVLQIDRPRMERLWDELPLADLDIAAMLQTTGPRVVGLRRAARERLDRFLRRRGGQRG